jgi:hypothetical protein
MARTLKPKATAPARRKAESAHRAAQRSGGHSKLGRVNAAFEPDILALTPSRIRSLYDSFRLDFLDRLPALEQGILALETHIMLISNRLRPAGPYRSEICA